MQIVAVQLNSVWEDKPATHERVCELLASRPIESNSLIVLPEMFDTGFSMNTSTTGQTEANESESFLREMADSSISRVGRCRLPVT